MAQNPFDDLARELPDGAFWVTGKWCKRLLAALTADRVRAGANLDEHPSDKGRFFNAKAGGSADASEPTPPLTVEDASAADTHGTPHPGRVRVYKGRLGGKLPTNMNLVDALLPGGTDNRCYLTLANGTNFVYGKVLVDAATGAFTSAVVYVVQEEEEFDGTYVYLPIAEVTYDGTTVQVVEQFVTGNQKLKVYTSPDGSILTPDWELQT